MVLELRYETLSDTSQNLFFSLEMIWQMIPAVKTDVSKIWKQKKMKTVETGCCESTAWIASFKSNFMKKEC